MFSFGIFFEIFSYFLLKTNLIRDVLAEQGFTKSQHFTASGLNWRNEKNTWGPWHIHNSTDRHVKSCFDVEYKANSIGARDNEFSKKSNKKRVLLIGDSMGEGYGLSEENKIDTKIESLVKNDVLNFSTAYYFGPLQTYILYRDLASEYDHESLILLFLPNNDFRDNDPKSVLSVFGNQYRPYYKKLSNNSYTYFYPKNAIKREKINIDKRAKINAFLYPLKTFRLIRNVRLITKFRDSNNTASLNSNWFNTKEYQEDAALYWINETIKMTDSSVKRVVIFAIPDQDDINFKISSLGKVAQPRWVNKMNELSEKNSKVFFVNGLDFIPNDKNKISRMFLPCDGHWSNEGSEWAAKVLANYLN